MSPQSDMNLLMMLPPGDRVSQCFRCMEVAEEEIATARERFPLKQKQLHESFRLLTPTTELAKVERAYRAHCREILDAVADGLEPPSVSWAEVALAFCHGSLLSPFIAEAAIAYGLAFRRAFPEEARAMEIPESGDELYMIPEAEAMLVQVRRRIAAAKGIKP